MFLVSCIFCFDDPSVSTLTSSTCELSCPCFPEFIYLFYYFRFQALTLKTCFAVVRKRSLYEGSAGTLQPRKKKPIRDSSFQFDKDVFLQVTQEGDSHDGHEGDDFAICTQQRNQHMGFSTSSEGIHLWDVRK